MTTASPTLASAALQPARVRQRELLRRLLATRFGPLGALIVLLVVVAGVAAPWLAPYEPAKTDIVNMLMPPDGGHLLGTDDLGRDILSRIIYGARVSIGVSLVSVSLALIVGTSIGLVAGYVGTWADMVLMRIMDALLSFPALILALAIATVLGTGLTAAMIAIAIVYVPVFARLTRGQVLGIRATEYVVAALAIGATAPRVVLRHILPNGLAPIIVQASLSMAFAILAEASLSFLGLGVRPPEPSWGSMVSAGRQYLGDAPWLAFAPGLAILVTVVGLNFLGDALRDALDPRLRL